MEVDGNEYEEDVTPGGKSNFISFSDRWAYSSTGVFLGDENANYRETSSNASISSIYRTARLAPLSLKYYGLCLRRGSYNVKLHFAEIMYTSDQTFSSLGERIFDISIQVSEKWKENWSFFFSVRARLYILNLYSCIHSTGKFGSKRF